MRGDGWGVGIECVEKGQGPAGGRYLDVWGLGFRVSGLGIELGRADESDLDV